MKKLLSIGLLLFSSSLFATGQFVIDPITGAINPVLGKAPAGPPSPPAGPTGAVQYNNGTSTAGSSNFLFDGTNAQIFGSLTAGNGTVYMDTNGLLVSAFSVDASGDSSTSGSSVAGSFTTISNGSFMNDNQVNTPEISTAQISDQSQNGIIGLNQGGFPIVMNSDGTAQFNGTLTVNASAIFGGWSFDGNDTLSDLAGVFVAQYITTNGETVGGYAGSANFGIFSDGATDASAEITTPSAAGIPFLRMTNTQGNSPVHAFYTDGSVSLANGVDTIDPAGNANLNSVNTGSYQLEGTALVESLSSDVFTFLPNAANQFVMNGTNGTLTVGTSTSVVVTPSASGSSSAEISDSGNNWRINGDGSFSFDSNGFQPMVYIPFVGELSVQRIAGDGSGLTNLPPSNPAGSNQNIQYNNSGTAAGDPITLTDGSGNMQAHSIQSDGFVWNINSSGSAIFYGGVRAPVFAGTGATSTSNLAYSPLSGLSGYNFYSTNVGGGMTTGMFLMDNGSYSLAGSDNNTPIFYDNTSSFFGTPVVGFFNGNAAIDPSGNVTAASFTGSGSGLTNVVVKKASGDLKAQTAAVSSIATYTPSAAGTFQIGGYLTILAVSVDVIQLRVSYLDQNNTGQTVNLFPQGLTSASLATTGVYLFPTTTIRATSVGAVTVKTVLTTGAGSISYDVGATITQIQ